MLQSDVLYNGYPIDFTMSAEEIVKNIQESMTTLTISLEGNMQSLETTYT
jgi:hypothetical protein